NLRPEVQSDCTSGRNKPISAGKIAVIMTGKRSPSADHDLQFMIALTGCAERSAASVRPCASRLAFVRAHRGGEQHQHHGSSDEPEGDGPQPPDLSERGDQGGSDP